MYLSLSLIVMGCKRRFVSFIAALYKVKGLLSARRDRIIQSISPVFLEASFLYAGSDAGTKRVKNDNETKVNMMYVVHICVARSAAHISHICTIYSSARRACARISTMRIRESNTGGRLCSREAMNIYLPTARTYMGQL